MTLDELSAQPGDSTPGRGQSLYSGTVGLALFHASTGTGGQAALRRSAAAMLAEPIVADPDGCGLYQGAPAVAYAISFTEGSPAAAQALTTLDQHITNLTRSRLTQAHRRIDDGELPAVREFDLISGLTGLGIYHLRRDHQAELRDILTYLVRLTEPLSTGDTTLPGWWTSDSPNLRPSPQWPDGHGNLGLAHGIAGPLAFLATAMRRGHTVSGQAEAIVQICRWLDRWRTATGGHTWWPQIVTVTGHRHGTTGPSRPSWCYGTPGLARAQQLAGIALGDHSRQHDAERALAACLMDEQQLAQLTDPSLCHGWAGLIQTTRRTAEDAASDELATHLPGLNVRLDEHLRRHGLPDEPGLMDGISGIHLTRHITHVAWDECLLLPR